MLYTALMDSAKNQNEKSARKKHSRILIGSIVSAIALLAASVWLIGRMMQPSSQPTTQPTSTQETSPPPAPATKPKPTLSYVDQTLAAMSLRDKVASLFIFHTPGTDSTRLASYMTTYRPSGFIFMGDNIPVGLDSLRAETRALVKDPKLPPLLAIDEEGDTVKRLASDTYPGALTLPDKPPAATRDAFAQRSELLKSTGFNLNFGIIADVTANPYSFIYPRVLGTTPQAAAERVVQAVEGSKGKTLSTLKHFPGHGETTANSHTSIPTATTASDDWRRRVALPFKAGIDAGADLVMFGHLRYDAVDTLPASLSKKWHDIIRSDLGFKGLIITDDMIMLHDSGEASFADSTANAVSAVQAGNDLLLYVLDHESEGSKLDPNTLIDGLVAAVNDGRLDPGLVDERVRRVLNVRHDLSQ